jgi:hypothetical protein
MPEAFFGRCCRISFDFIRGSDTARARKVRGQRTLRSSKTGNIQNRHQFGENIGSDALGDRYFPQPGSSNHYFGR